MRGGATGAVAETEQRNQRCSRGKAGSEDWPSQRLGASWRRHGREAMVLVAGRSSDTREEQLQQGAVAAMSQEQSSKARVAAHMEASGGGAAS